MDQLTRELSQAGCLPCLVELFVECHQQDPTKRPLMSAIHSRLQRLVMQDARDSARLREELKRAEAQDRDTYGSTWNAFYANQSHSRELLEYVANMESPAKLGSSRFFSSLTPFRAFFVFFSKTSQLFIPPPNISKSRILFFAFLVVRQPLKQREGKGSMEELQQLATATLCGRLHTYLKSLVEECGGTYLCAPRKSYERCMQKVEQECEGDYSRLLDVERATGLFEQAEDMLLCLRRVRGGGERQEGEGQEQTTRPIVVGVGGGPCGGFPLLVIIVIVLPFLIIIFSCHPSSRIAPAPPRAALQGPPQLASLERLPRHLAECVRCGVRLRGGAAAEFQQARTDQQPIAPLL